MINALGRFGEVWIVTSSTWEQWGCRPGWCGEILIELMNKPVECVDEASTNGDGEPRMQVYIAAPWELREEGIELMRRLHQHGHEVTSSWLTATVSEVGDAVARLDLADVDRADVMVALNPPGWATSGTGGRHFEAGYAYAKGKPIVLVGERSHVFHSLSEIVVVADEGELLKALRSLKKAA